MGSWWDVFDESNDFFVCSDEWLVVGFSVVCCSPDGDGSDEVWVYE